MHRDLEEVGAILARVQRKTQPWGITVSYLARHMGVSRQYVWQALNGRGRVSRGRAEQLEAAVDGIISSRGHLSTFGGRLRAARLAAGYTLKEIAGLIGYSWVGVERWEKDLCLPKPGVLWHLLRLYGAEGKSLTSDGSPTSLPRYAVPRPLPHFAGGAREELARSIHALGRPPYRRVEDLPSAQLVARHKRSPSTGV
jgi:transcriptional regulator with XRE-family HTH domain